MSDLLTDDQIAVLAEQWPWPEEDVATALRMAEREGWMLDDTVRALDRLAADFGDESDPVMTVRAAIAYKRRQARETRW